MPIVQMLDTSLSHISMNDYHLLQAMAREVEAGEHPEFRVHATEVTIVIYVVWAWPWGARPKVQQKDCILERLDEGFSPEFCELVLAAAELKCWLIQLDQDADEDEGFSVFSGDKVIERRPTSRLEGLISNTSNIESA
ncbi:hypothetical protein [Roseibium sp. SCP14]|uniref:DUF5983 family protein n=1 Tax=Roseibium sp. SCP14 TaxID=3141375 RepID=UPI003336621D